MNFLKFFKDFQKIYVIHRLLLVLCGANYVLEYAPVFNFLNFHDFEIYI